MVALREISLWGWYGILKVETWRDFRKENREAHKERKAFKSFSLRS
jgi:hypothetical protein